MTPVSESPREPEVSRETQADVAREPPALPSPSVSRETAGALFGPRAAQAIAYAELLRSEGIRRGLIGPREAERIWERHIVNCAVVAPAFPPDAVVADVGSGAGLPGVVLAIARPDLRLRLVEPLLRRATFLAEVVTRLELEHVEVVRSRVEDLPSDVQVDVVTARAVAPVQRLARWCLPIVRPGGLLLAMKGEQATAELAQASSTLRSLGAASWSVRTFGEGVTDPPARLVVVRMGEAVRSSTGAARPAPPSRRATRRSRS